MKLKQLFAMTLVLIPLLGFAQEIHYDRNQLPQLNIAILEQSQFADSIEIAIVPVSELKPVQTQRVKDLVKHEKRLIKAQQDTYRPLVIDHDYYIIDGHHRYDALTEMGVEKARVLIVHANIADVVEAFPQYRDDTPTYESTTMEEVRVVGSRANLINAVDKQMMADNIISVVDSDALGNFPDATAADAVRRLSGINVENDQGEGRYITIRGLSSDLNAVSVNGASMVAPENGRSVIMDGIPTELLDSITVAKSLVPEMDSDSIGGRVEFNTKRATELEDRLFNVKLSTKWSEKDDKKMPNASVIYGDYITDNIAHIVGLTYSSRRIISHNNETGFGWSDGLMNDDYEMRWYDVERERYGFSYDIAYDAGTTLYYANILHNQYDETETRFKNEYGKIKNTGATFDNAVESSRVRHDVETKQRYETRTISAASLGFEHFGSVIIDGQLSFSRAEEDDSDNADITFRNYDKDFGALFDWSNPRLPTVTPYDPTLRDPANLEFDAFETWSNVSEDEEVAAQLNFEFDTGLGTIKTGMKYRGREKVVDDYIIGYTWDRTLANFESESPDWIWDQTFGSHLSGSDTYALLDSIDQMEVDFEDALSRDFSTKENIMAVYVQDTIELEDAVIILGVRYEATDFKSIAYDQNGDLVYAENDYDFVAPNLTVKYFLNDNIQVRGALWRGLSRPGFKETAPKTSVDVDTSGDTSGSVGNPGLLPYEADNLDLSIEYYGEGMTFASIGFFYKNIANAIYPTYQLNGTFNGITFNDGVETWINADDSTVKGLEVNLQYGWENGLYVALNGTLTDSESVFSFDNDQSFSTPFRKLADNAANLSLGYETDKLDVRLAGTYRGAYLDWLADEDGDITNVSDNNSRYVAPHMQIDLTAKYIVNESMTVRFEAININDRNEYYYWGNENQLSQFDNYGASYVVGVDFRL